jgi:haloalkane dehalogenase
MRTEPAPPLPGFLAHELPFDRGLAIVQGDRLHFVDEAAPTARAVILLFHGNPTWSFLWRKVIRELAPRESGLRVIAPDLLGLGLSDKPRSPRAHTLALHVSRMHELIEGLLAHDPLRDRVVVVGQDWGGPIGAGVAMRLEESRPGSVRAMLWANTGVLPPRQFKTTAFHRFAHAPVVSDVAFRLLGFPLWSLDGVQGRRGSIRGKVARAYRWPLRDPRDRAAPIGLARMVPNTPDHPTVPHLEAIGRFVTRFERPIGLVWGTKDPILGRALERHERELRPVFVERTDAGHFLQEEVPELLAKRIGELARGASAP